MEIGFLDAVELDESKANELKREIDIVETNLVEDIRRLRSIIDVSNASETKLSYLTFQSVIN